MLKNPLLTVYWIKTSDPHGPLGFGVTAYSVEDALALIHAAGYTPTLPPTAIQEVTDLNALGESSVVAHSGPIIFRGVWYPRQVVGADGRHPHGDLRSSHGESQEGPARV